ncbi:MAG: tetratricopeptide repeat protein, partial [Bacillota bacterium]
MNSLLLPILLSNAMAAPAATSVVKKVDLVQDLKNSGYVNLYDLPAGAKVPKLSQLAQLKNHEIHGRWNECLTLAPKVFVSEKKVNGWVANVWLHCLSSAQDKKNVIGSEDHVLTTIAKSWDLFEKGPWSQDLWQSWVSQELEYLSNEVKKKNSKVENRIERLLDNSSRLSREQISLSYQMLGDLAILRNDYQEAQFMFEESQSYKDSKYISERLDFLAKTRGQVIAKATTVTTVEPIGDDGKLEERIRQSLKLNDLIPALKDSVALLNQYPGSRSARRLKDKPLEIYNSITDKAVADKALGDMQEADATRLLEWAQNLHRRGDWAASLVLADKAYSKNPQSQSVTSSLWIAGRSAHFLGQYDKAMEYFSKLTLIANGSDEGAEALYRSALIYFRKHDFTTAAALLERLLQQ